MTMQEKSKADALEFNESKEYFLPLKISAKWENCKCRGNGWCELHDHFNPEDDSHA